VDTRAKIVNFEALPSMLSRGNWSAVTGWFDPLTLVQAERLSTIARDGRRIAAIVVPGNEPLLSSYARATLIAALRYVDAVAIGEPDQVEKLYSQLPNLRVHQDDQAEQLRSAEFVEFVRTRQKSAEALK
jgi:glycerol-3-phosphate cytidylyltransferase-like family protein